MEIIVALGLLVFIIWLYFWFCSQLYRIGENIGLDYNWISYIPGFQIIQVMRLAGLGWGVGWLAFIAFNGTDLILMISSNRLGQETLYILIAIRVFFLILEIVAWCMLSARLKQGWAWGLAMLIPLIKLLILFNFAQASKQYAIANGIKTLQDFESKKTKDPIRQENEEAMEDPERLQELQDDLGIK